MVASTAECETDGVFEKQQVGSDAYVSRHMRQMSEGGRSFSGNERDKLFINRGDGTFADCSDLSGCDDPNDGRGVIAADFDDDGDVDMFIHHTQRERHTLQRNELGQGGGFIKVRLRATTAQYEAIGATVVVHGPHGPVADVLSRGAGFVSCQAPELIFGVRRGAEAVESEAATVSWDLLLLGVVCVLALYSYYFKFTHKLNFARKQQQNKHKVQVR